MTIQPAGRVQPLRKLIHLGGALFALLYLVASRPVVIGVTLGLLALVILVESGRQYWSPLERLFEIFIGPAMRAGEENKPTAGTWSMLGIALTVLFFRRELAISAILFAHLGDPAAEIIGRRWGQHRLPNGKSIEGSLGCLTVSLATGLACSQLLPLPVGVAALGALVATVAEATPLPLGDNLLMAPLAGLAMTLVIG